MRATSINIDIYLLDLSDEARQAVIEYAAMVGYDIPQEMLDGKEPILTWFMINEDGVH